MITIANVITIEKKIKERSKEVIPKLRLRILKAITLQGSNKEKSNNAINIMIFNRLTNWLEQTNYIFGAPILCLPSIQCTDYKGFLFLEFN